jgi:hypothetical protein
MEIIVKIQGEQYLEHRGNKTPNPKFLLEANHLLIRGS